MSTEVQGLLTFVANGDPAGMLARVQAMVGELAALGVTPRVVVTVDLASTSRSSSSPISAETGMSGRGVAGMSMSPDPIRPSVEERSGIDGGERDGVVSDVSMSAGEDFLSGGARGEGRGAEEEAQRSMGNGQLSMVDGVDEVDEVDEVDWSQLSTMAAETLESLGSGWTTWRKVPKAIRLELVQAVLIQPTESGRPMTMGEFDRLRPAWMPAAGSLPTTFGCSWPDLRTLRLSE